MADYNSSLTGDQIEQTLLGAVLSNKAQRLTEEQKAQARKNIGAGTSDSGLKILGYYATADQMAAAVLSPKAGDAYAVGTEAPYDIYIWDAVHRIWVNNGNIRGADGKDADLSDAEPKKHKFTDVRIAPSSYDADATYPDFPFRAAIPLGGINETMTPCVAFDVAEAIGGLFAPLAECYNGGVYIYAESALNYEIIIPTIICWEGVYAVEDPAAGKLILSYDDLRALVQNEVDAAGEYATQSKETAEQAQYYADQAKAYADEAKTGNVADGAVTAEKIADGAVSDSFAVLLTVSGWADNVQTLTANGVTADNTVVVSPTPSSYDAYAESLVRCTAQGENSLTFTCKDVPADDITVNVTVINK